MKKKVFALLLTLLLALQMIPMAFGANAIPATDVKIDASMQVREGGADDWQNANDALEMTTADMAGTVDFRVALDTADVRRALIDWYEYGISLIEDVSNGNADHAQALKASFDSWPVSGTFTITVDFPKEFSIPSEYKTEPLAGFIGADKIFEEVDRKITGGTCEITVQIRDGVLAGELYEKVKAVDEGNGEAGWLDELVWVVEGVKTGTFTGTCTVTGSLVGETTFGGQGSAGYGQETASFSTDTVEATLTKISTASPSTSKEYTITFNIDGKTDAVASIEEKGTVKTKNLPVPEKDGYTFDGWYTDSAMTKKIGDSIRVSKDMTLYGHWSSKTLETEKHYAYVLGYPDNTIRPDDHISREEVAMMFYRLLKDDVRASLLVKTNDFSDIASDRWSNTAISTLVNGKYIVGRTDGMFDAGADITRAEFATMATRFANLTDDADVQLNDIEGHWAESYIRCAAAAGWISGYPDGTFRPDDPITRAEAMTLVNRVLSRSVDDAGVHKDAKVWSDIQAGDWYYSIVMEATNAHTYAKQADGLQEKWSAIIENKDWD